ncbi:MAG: FAD-dependent oxidoreductase [Oscillatoriales cyanobacterium RU_3_3]|nr:FAD-dependent oxidoreductase [Oscillatoriales cyanobacterium RU_3_3]
MSQDLVQDLVLIGGGHSHAIVLKMFGTKPLPGVRLTLISDVSHAPYSGMLPGHVAGFYSYDECHIDLRSLAEFAGCELVVDRAIAIDFNRSQVICQNRPPVKFDLLSIDIGSTPATLSVSGAAKYAVPAKPVPEFLANWNQLIAWRQNHPEMLLRIAIVGGGAGGVELALNMQARLTKEEGRGKKEEGRRKKEKELEKLLEIHLFHSGAELMSGHNKRVRLRLQEILVSRGIQLHLMEKVYAVKKPEIIETKSDYQIYCQSGLELECDRIFWVTQAAAANWIEESDLSTDEKGFIQVNDCLQSISHSNVFAAGDIAAMINYPRPKAGVFAVRQGKPLFENLQQFLLGKPLKPFVPQQQYLSLIGTANKSAIASRGSWMWESPLLWYWKDWIDRQFMKRFR